MKNISDEEKNAINPNFADHNILIIWQPEYNLGIPIVDEQHRGIVSIINSLYYGMQGEHDDRESVLAPIVDMMYDYTHIHFKTEENFLEKFKFPYIKQHHELHGELTGTLSKVSRKSLVNHDSYEFMEFLKKWWIDHICDRDRKFRDYLF